MNAGAVPVNKRHLHAPEDGSAGFGRINDLGPGMGRAKEKKAENNHDGRSAATRPYPVRGHPGSDVIPAT